MRSLNDQIMAWFIIMACFMISLYSCGPSTTDLLFKEIQSLKSELNEIKQSNGTVDKLLNQGIDREMKGVDNKIDTVDNMHREDSPMTKNDPDENLTEKINESSKPNLPVLKISPNPPENDLSEKKNSNDIGEKPSITKFNNLTFDKLNEKGHVIKNTKDKPQTLVPDQFTSFMATQKQRQKPVKTPKKIIVAKQKPVLQGKVESVKYNGPSESEDIAPNRAETKLEKNEKDNGLGKDDGVSKDVGTSKDDVESLYKRATEAYQEKRFLEAQRDFLSIVKTHPRHDLADNALYWVGECYYDKEDYETAMHYFNQIVRQYPSANKVPDALLKIGLCYEKQNDLYKAKEFLYKVMDKFPMSDAARVAVARVETMSEKMLND